MYRVHKYLGITALIMMIVHNVLEPDFEGWVEETPLDDPARTSGKLRSLRCWR